MRTTQEIFDVVIDEGIYGRTTSRFMCTALNEALWIGAITEDEHDIARKDVEDYLDGWFTLGAAVGMSGLPSSFSDILAIYRNWANRPQLMGKSRE